jgi:hypothetical protein
MTVTRATLTLLAVLVVGACASTPNGTAQELAGCYYFEQDATARELNLPWGVHLTADALTGWEPLDQEPDTYTAVTLVGPDETQDFPFGYWQDRGADSVRIGYPSMGGFVLELTLEDGHLVGTARGVGDAGLDQRPTHDIRLQRAGCPE